MDEFALCLSWDIHLLLPLDIGASGSQDFVLKLNYTTGGFPDSLACKGEVMELLSFHNYVRQFL